jgi:hypothetical protein
MTPGSQGIWIYVEENSQPTNMLFPTPYGSRHDFSIEPCITTLEVYLNRENGNKILGSLGPAPEAAFSPPPPPTSAFLEQTKLLFATSQSHRRLLCLSPRNPGPENKKQTAHNSLSPQSTTDLSFIRQLRGKFGPSDSVLLKAFVTTRAEIRDPAQKHLGSRCLGASPPR